ncbi:glycosyltransferase [Longispora albida]|uniref:glycosyltransferase n=1 Tax=Longispora albida TaxID=203523 RepID=UPI00037989E6|nr:glycosyltransferase [Longispora albida]
MIVKHRSLSRTHWLLFLLGLTGVLAALAVDGFTAAGSGGTVRPGQVTAGNRTRAFTGPVIEPDGTARRLPDQVSALTFDDGPDPVWTPRILDQLRKLNVKATFFVVGARVAEHPELARRIVDEGHELGLHSYTHADLGAVPAWRARAELELTRDAVASATGRDVTLFRPPYSSTPAGADARLIGTAGRAGYRTVLADLDTRDWSLPGPDAIVTAAAQPGDAGAIILMHAGGGDRAQTVTALRTLVPALSGRGRRLVTVSEALSLPEPAAAGWEARARGASFGVVRSIAGAVADILFVLLVLATVLAGVRMLIQGGAAWRHARRGRRSDPDEGYRPPVTVIVPAHNEAANIAATVESLTATEYPGLEIVVVDDGSVDGTGKIVAGLALPQVVVVRQDNAGKAAALSTGIAHASNDLIVLIDGDTIIEQDTLALLVQPFRDPKVGAVAGNAKVANRSGLLGRWQHLEYVIAFNLDRRVFEVAECMPTVPGALGAFRRAALAGAGGVSTATLAEDTDLTMAVCRAGWKIVYADRACAWTEAPSTWGGLWRQRYRWCFGTMQAMWKHRSAVRELGAGGKLGRRGLGYLMLFQILQPMLAPLVDVYMVYALLFQPVTWVAALWLGLHACQLGVAAYAFRLDRERAGPLWSLLLQQVVYRQLIYLVVIQSLVTALVGARVGWHQPARTGEAAALTSAAVTPDGERPVAMRRQMLDQQIRRKYRDPLWARLTVWAGVLLMLASGGALVAGKVVTDRYAARVQQADLLGPALLDDNSGPLNMLLVGVDWRKGAAGLIRADTIMIVHVPASRDRAYLFSLPRDLLVDIPGHGRDRINASFAYGAGGEQDRARGSRLLADVTRRATGLPGFHAAALIDFYGFMEVVKAVDGVQLCVDEDTKSIHSGVVYKKGCRKMDGPSALDYLRQRKTIAHGDYARQRHQQQFIKAAVTGSGTDPARLDLMLRAAGESLTVTTGRTSPAELLFALRGISPDRITLIRTPGHSVRDQSGYLGEALNPEAVELFRAVASDDLTGYLKGHPALVLS